MSTKSGAARKRGRTAAAEGPDRRDLLEQLDLKAEAIFAGIGHDGSIHPHETLDHEHSNMIRMQRAISWLKQDFDLGDSSETISFIVHWIAFESLYSKVENASVPPFSFRKTALEDIMDFIGNIEKNESDRLDIIEAVDGVRAEIKGLLDNPFVSDINWNRYYKGRKTKAGKRHNPFAGNGAAAKIPSKKALNDQNKLDGILKEMFRRMYILRNQLFHGNSSYKGSDSSARSEQIVCGARVMRALMPVLITSMLNAMERYRESERWGTVLYPRIRNAEKPAGRKSKKARR